MYAKLCIFRKQRGSNRDSDMEIISRPYEKMNPNAVAYVAGNDKAMAAASVMLNINRNPMLRGADEVANEEEGSEVSAVSGRDDEINKTAKLVTTKVAIHVNELLGMFFLGSSMSVQAKLMDSIPT